jgi:hypothetical protein
MPEGTSDASILIATSFQALNRVIQDNTETMVCDSTVVILFAAFFIEANLNYIIHTLNREEEMLDFLYGKRRRGTKHPGLQYKLKWFYSKFVDTSFSDEENKSLKGKITEKLEVIFPGFEKIHEFRNEISHGKIDLSLANRKDAEEIRQQAKNIVDKLYDVIVEKTGIKIPRDITYMSAIASSM